MDIFNGKKLLILGGAALHVKLINAAKELGVHTIVTDNLPFEKSPGKQIADEYWDNNVYDISGLVKRCQENQVDGIITGWLDPCQRPYAELCKLLGFPCCGTPEQFFRMTDKIAFKQMCRDYGVDTIQEFSYADFENDKIVFPVFVKPNDSRGSRGQSICYEKKELIKAIELAKKESSNQKVIIERYMKGLQEFQVTYFFIDGEPYLLRTCDSYCGTEDKQMENVVACSISPSRYTQTYLDSAHQKVVRMFKSLGIKNGPLFMQGFVDNGVFYFFDPGFRFPGVDYEQIYKRVFDVDLMKIMVSFALNGRSFLKQLPRDGVWLNGKCSAILFPSVKAGLISNIQGTDLIREEEGVVSAKLRYSIGDRVDWTYDVNQRIAEIDCIADNLVLLKQLIKRIQELLHPFDINNQDMIYEVFDTNRLG